MEEVFWSGVCWKLAPTLAGALIMAMVFVPVLFLVVEEEPDLPPHVERIETFWRFSSTKDTVMPFNSTVCVVYEPSEGVNETIAPVCHHAPLNANEFSKVGDYFVAHAECRERQHQILEGRCRVVEVHPHTVKPRLVMHGRHHGSFLCQWFGNKHTKELVVVVETTCK